MPLSIPQANPAQEKRDHLLGRVFAYKAIIQSSILVHPDSPKECWANVLEQLFRLAREKPWLREECGLILCDGVKLIAQEKGELQLVQRIVDGLCSDGLAKTPEGIAVWLTVQSVFPDLELPQGIWHKQDPLCTKERQTLANVMKENFAKSSDGAAESGKLVKAGSSNNTLNFAWDVVIATFMQKNAEEGSGKIQSKFSNFWTDVVDSESGPICPWRHVSNPSQITFSRHRRRPNKSPKASSSFQECLATLPNGRCRLSSVQI